MKFHLLSFFFTVMLTISCNNSPLPGGDSAEIEKNKATKSKPGSSYVDTIIISSPAAVFFNPDSLQLEKIKDITEPMIFESTLHDCFYQMRNSRIILKQYYAHIKIIEVKKARYLLFVKPGDKKEKVYVDLNAKNDPCGIMIFDGIKAPRLVDMTNMESELGFYFAK
ncbi:MAG: hypothetical protein ACXWV1_15230 [Chitinophagaceae bacterium]